MGIPNVGELRDFSITVNKSDISVGQCAQGYRMVQLMKNLGVADEDDDVIDGGSDGRRNYIEFSTFVLKIYLNCKNLGILQALIPSRNKDKIY